MLRAPESLKPSGIAAIYECRVDVGVRGAGDAGRVLEELVGRFVGGYGLRVSRIVSLGSEPVGTSYRIFKFRVLVGTSSLKSRCIVKGDVCKLVVILVDRSVADAMDIGNVEDTVEEPGLPEAPRGAGGELPPGQRAVDRFAVYRAFGEPRVDLGSWRLRVEGAVETPIEVSYRELISMGTTRYVADFHCVTGWSVRDVLWEGVRLRDIVRLAKPLREARWAMLYSVDGYSAVVPLEDLLWEASILALKLNGRPLKPEQGFPARIFIPHLYGWKGVKWASKIVLMERYRDGYWEALGYHWRGNVWLEQRFKM